MNTFPVVRGCGCCAQRQGGHTYLEVAWRPREEQEQSLADSWFGMEDKVDGSQGPDVISSMLVRPGLGLRVGNTLHCRTHRRTWFGRCT